MTPYTYHLYNRLKTDKSKYILLERRYSVLFKKYRELIEHSTTLKLVSDELITNRIDNLEQLSNENKKLAKQIESINNKYNEQLVINKELKEIPETIKMMIS
tara:strand:+ start:819 stop:1124 length:306 start_codon:yes stop_codon:yes gene_type:complete